ncbi:MAG: ATP-grasp domain-containing protein [Pseudoclavibacter sp.]|nr:ATP-grasp domain-containing protein [Pseudoclavibacter sp.]
MKVIILRPGVRGATSHVVESLVVALRDRGVESEQIHPAEFDADAPLPEADIVVLKDKTPLGLEWGRRYHDRGVRTVSPYPMTALCRDKLATNRALARAGLPVPECLAVARPEDVLPMLADGPVILKPVRGSQGRGITIVADAAGLPDAFTGETLFAQRYFPPDGLDRKIYRIGDEIFCVERIWPPETFSDKVGRLIELPRNVREIAMACGDALGGDIYGVDIIEHEGRPWIVDLSSFPGFKGVPEIGTRLAAAMLRSPDSERPAAECLEATRP